ncbi:ATP-binding protein [Microbacterium betulae]|uniref:ATP-binding protein n=1 Tax=Microbacterium betulae TaxID=2981139 RepID=A0AA97FJX8_9MICO|nr:ATP-binding protein [Microbacterium sp. AB]WOF24153.1 ATP-binding protein [Microbacterium sp. AB]
MPAAARDSAPFLAGQEAVAEAWRHVLPRSGVPAALGRGFAAARVERILQVALALASLLVGVQSFLTATASDLQPPVRAVLTMVVFASLAAMIVLCTLGRAVRVGCAVFAVTFPVALLLLWPLPEPRHVPTGGPWTLTLINVAPAAATMVFPLAWQIVWAIGVPLIFGLVRLTRDGHTASDLLASLYDISLALILGVIVIVLIWTFRSLAAGVDAARDAAISEYSRAASAEASEQERVEVAALMHDSVLAALLAAGRAHSERERQLAVSMAREALTRLANAETDEPWGSDEPVTSEWIRSEVRAQARALGTALAVDGRGPVVQDIPGRAARALVLAATQAVANAIQHAGGAGLAVRVAASGPGVEVVISDEGDGVDLAAIPPDRLGIRASIFARVAAVGGSAHVDADGSGTVVTLTWPASGEEALRAFPGGEGRG